MSEGRLFRDDDERVRLLGLLLENVGVDRAVQLGPPAVWWEAVSARLRAHARFVLGVGRRLSVHERELIDIARSLRGQR